jgi:hypothetical protein
MLGRVQLTAMPPTQLPLNVEALVAAWGTPVFFRMLEGQLLAHGSKIPLEKACESGGRPDDPHFYNFRPSEPDRGTLSITFEATFRETASPGCGGAASEQTRFAEFTITITRNACLIEYHAPQPEPEF